MQLRKVQETRHHLQPYIWEKHVECMSRYDIVALQSERLSAGIQYLSTISPYKERFKKHGVHPKEIKSIDDLEKLPFTTKDDLRDHYPFGLFATPIDQIVELHTSTGTTGKPTVVGYSKADISLWSNLIARALAATGVRPGTLIQDAFNFGVTTGGQGFQYGAELIGATVLPVSGGNANRQLMFFEDLGAHVLLCTPSYALTLAEIAQDQNLDLSRINLEAGIFGAETWSEPLRKRIEESWNITAYDTYGLSEIIGPGVAHECHVRNGLHIYEDHFFPEVIDPKTLKPLPAGEVGELVITAVTKEALPMIRYRTGDLAKLSHLACECGRTLIRMSRTAGRAEQVLTVNNKSIFPGQVETIVFAFDELSHTYQILVDRREKSHAKLDVCVESSSEIIENQQSKQQLMSRLERATAQSLGIPIDWHIVPYRTIPRTEGKANRVMYKGHGAISLK